MHRLGPDNATLSVHTKRGGAAAKAGHDLELHVTRWEATLDLDAGTAELSADGSSLRVEKGEGGMQKLGEEDKENILKTIDDEVLEKRNITFRAASVNGGDGHYQVDGAKRFATLNFGGSTATTVTFVVGATPAA